MTVLTPESKVVAAPNQVSSELAGESVILNLQTGLYYGLNEVGAYIWQAIQSPKTIAEICQAVMQEYDISTADCEADVQDLLKDLLAAKLVEVRPPGPEDAP
ncbi:PqqD family protein [Lyngbya confervoides]|uniref:PqqD family peptide modification chaperone n=1 Tax=Lyngbya confervoides BDU141951 TaxID=1574623 RepID=A0ABD4SXC1_9CYAN|nr:PqqD family protein [Lyngbya confervoides]MCM1981264.1 PqqD family peptide modification chaperone [Lyngbya confervoides BDU141951]